MNAHTPLPAGERMIAHKTVIGMEGAVNDLARLAHAVHIIAETIRKEFNSWAKIDERVEAARSAMEADLEVLFAYVDDVDLAARDLRVDFYRRLA